MKSLIIFLLLLPLLALAQAQPQQAASIYPFASVKKQQQFTQIIGSLRCLVCQNQSLLDSNAKLAVDLRNQVYKMLKAGKTKPEILAYMTARYGDFILLKPPVNKTTWVLWFGPFALLILVLLTAMMVIKKHQNRAEPDLTQAETEKVEKLLSLKKKKSEIAIR